MHVVNEGSLEHVAPLFPLFYGASCDPDINPIGAKFTDRPVKHSSEREQVMVEQCATKNAAAVLNPYMSRLLISAVFVIAVSLPQGARASCGQVLGAALPPTCVGNSQCQCLTTVDPVCHPQGKILDTFIARGGCDTFGKPLNRIRPRLAFGGKYQTFEWGEIAHYPTFANGAKTPDFVISGLQPKDPSQPAHRLPFISVRWGPAKPFSYDSFLIRWDREDNEKSVAEQHEDEAQQAEAGSGDRGFFRIDASNEGTYTIYVEGCEDGFFGKSCDQGFCCIACADRIGHGRWRWRVGRHTSV